MPDDKKVSAAARALGRLGAADGGKARAASLTPEQRQDIARAAAEARWGKTPLPRETHPGRLIIAGRELPCSVLEGGIRVFSTRGVNRALGSRRTGAPSGAGGGAPQPPSFLGSEAIKPFISEDLMVRLLSPLQYKPMHGGRTAYGYEATLLPRICEAILDADKAGTLRKNQKHLAEAAQLLIRGFAHVGIIALVDEATGYQDERPGDELRRILEAYISEELRPWVKRFPNEFFRQIYRLHGWEYREGNHKHPQYVGKLVNALIYEPLPPPVLPALREKNPTNAAGRRRYKHHQLLTDDIGQPHLDKQITAVTTLMRAANGNRPLFETLFVNAFPKVGQQMPLPIPPPPDPVP